MNKLSVLFLDIDGVLAVDDNIVSNGPYGSYPFTPACVEVLNRVIEKTDCELVVSSDWRMHYNLRQMWDLFDYNKVVKRPLGFTEVVTKFTYPDDDGWVRITDLEKARATEVKRWLAQHGLQAPYPFWCAVDDLDMGKWLNHFVYANWHFGLTTPDVEEELVSFLTTGQLRDPDHR